MPLTRNTYQRNSSWSAPYTFSGKEKDAETGYGYFGARYYDSGLSIWLSVDPMSDKYPSMSPYNYCANNPVILVDPDGRELEPIVGTNGELLGCTKEGWSGIPIVMEKKNYKPGMSRAEALEQGAGKANGISLDQYGKGIRISEETWATIVSNGGTKIEPFLINNSNQSVFYKPEGIDDGVDKNPGYNNDGAYEVKANTDLYVQFDGVATSKFKKQVCKVPTGSRATINKDNGVTMHGTIAGTVRLLAKFGWIYRSNIPDKDSNWNNLFNKALELGKK